MLKKVSYFKLTSLDRYLLRSFLKQLFYSTFMFLGIYFFSALLAELPTLLKKAEQNTAITMGSVLLNFIYQIPDFFMTIFPFAYLFSTSFVLGNFYRNNEMVAMISSGLSMRRITSPLIFLSIVFSFFLIFLNNEWVPAYNYKSAVLEEQLYKETKAQDVDNIQTYGENGILYFARYYNARSKKFVSAMVLKAKDIDFKILEQNFIPMDFLDQLPVKMQISALKSDDGDERPYFPFYWIVRGDEMVFNEDTQQWIIQKGFKWTWDEQGKLENLEELSLYPLDVQEKPEYFSKETRNLKEMSVKETEFYIDKLKKSKQSYKKEEVDFYSEKYSKPFSILILALFATVLGKFFSRKHLLVMTLIFSFLIGVFYYTLLNIGISLGKEGYFPPFLSAFLGNFLSLGFYFYLAKKQLT